ALVQDRDADRVGRARAVVVQLHLQGRVAVDGDHVVGVGDVLNAGLAGERGVGGRNHVQRGERVALELVDPAAAAVDDVDVALQVGAALVVLDVEAEVRLEAGVAGVLPGRPGGGGRGRVNGEATAGDRPGLLLDHGDDHIILLAVPDVVAAHDGADRVGHGPGRIDRE